MSKQSRTSLFLFWDLKIIIRFWNDYEISQIGVVLLIEFPSTAKTPKSIILQGDNK